MTELQTQNEALLDFLRERGERGVTAMEVLAEVGSARAAARIKDLRDKGYDIRTEWIKLERGRRRGWRVAKYVLTEAPAQPFTEIGLWG